MTLAKKSIPLGCWQSQSKPLSHMFGQKGFERWAGMTTLYELATAHDIPKRAFIRPRAHATEQERYGSGPTPIPKCITAFKRSLSWDFDYIVGFWLLISKHKKYGESRSSGSGRFKELDPAQAKRILAKRPGFHPIISFKE